MESRNRNLWIIIAVIAVLLCLCAVIVAAIVIAGAGFFTAFPAIQQGGIGRVTERSEQVYDVGQAPQLEIDNFAGNLTVRGGESGRFRVIVEKKAMSDAGLQRISVGLEPGANGLRIRTSRPSGLNASESVDIEVYVPADVRLVLDTGAGNVQVDDIQAEIRAHTGAGNIDVRGAAGLVNVDTGAGNIDYEGEPRVQGTFETGAGNISLRLPADANVLIDLQTGLGNINLGGFAVQGDTSGTDIQGTIGTGEQATIKAQTGAGNIQLDQR